MLELKIGFWRAGNKIFTAISADQDHFISNTFGDIFQEEVSSMRRQR